MLSRSEILESIEKERISFLKRNKIREGEIYKAHVWTHNFGKEFAAGLTDTWISHTNGQTSVTRAPADGAYFVSSTNQEDVLFKLLNFVADKNKKEENTVGKILQDPQYFTIKRAQWIRGCGSKSSFINKDGHKDCFGWLLSKAGMSDDDMYNLYEPIDVNANHEWVTRLLIWSGSACTQSPTCHQIIACNDNVFLKDNEREKKLIELFAFVGINLKFED